MTTHALTGAPILAGGVWHDCHALLIDADGHIAGLVAADAIPAAIPVERVGSGFVLPGFIDTQVNGGGGVLFNDTPTVEGIAAIAGAHRAFGTTALLPTLISDDLAVVEQAVAAVDEAIAFAVPGVVGVHIEGPFLNSAKRGIHNAEKIRPLDDAAVRIISGLRNGKTLITLAPECVTPGTIGRLTGSGIIVSAGHSLATYEQMADAAAEGLTGVTHLFNAMSQLDSRAPGVVGAAIDLGLTAGLIVDGHHVHPASLRAALRAKGTSTLMLVTDAMPTVGSMKRDFRLGGKLITEQNGALRGEDCTLAGSMLDMASALRNAVRMLQVDLATASRMASGTPAAFLGIADSHGDLTPGMRADIVYVDDDLTPQATWIAGLRR